MDFLSCDRSRGYDPVQRSRFRFSVRSPQKYSEQPLRGESHTLASRENVLLVFPGREFSLPLGEVSPNPSSQKIQSKGVMMIKGRQRKEKRPTICIRLEQSEKDRIERLAEKCGLSVTEYLILRGTGYEPKPIPCEAVFGLIKRLDELIDKDVSPRVNDEAESVLKDITANLIYPVREGGESLLPQQDSGP